MHAHVPYQLVCGRLHAVPCIGQRIRTHWVIPSTRTTVPWKCTPQCRYKVFLLCRICCYILHGSRKEEYQQKYRLNIYIYIYIYYVIIKLWLSDARNYCTEHCIVVPLLVTVTRYKIRYMDLMCECVLMCVCVCVLFVFLLLVLLMGEVGNPFFNKRNRVWITEQNCDPCDKVSQ